MLLDQPIQSGKPEASSVDFGTAFQDHRGQRAEAEQKEPASAQRLKQMRWQAKHLIVRSPGTREQSRRELR
jgi:hypothetical protein